MSDCRGIAIKLMTKSYFRFYNTTFSATTLQTYEPESTPNRVENDGKSKQKFPSRVHKRTRS